MGGMVLETNMNEIITQVDSQNKMEKSEVSLSRACPLCDRRHSTPPLVLAAVIWRSVCRHVRVLHPACSSAVASVDDPSSILFESFCVSFITLYFSGLSPRCCTALNTGQESFPSRIPQLEIQRHVSLWRRWNYHCPARIQNLWPLNAHLPVVMWIWHAVLNRLVVGFLLYLSGMLIQFSVGVLKPFLSVFSSCCIYKPVSLLRYLLYARTLLCFPYSFICLLIGTF